MKSVIAKYAKFDFDLFFLLFSPKQLLNFNYSIEFYFLCNIYRYLSNRRLKKRSFFSFSFLSNNKEEH
jgi:hypothetical protein